MIQVIQDGVLGTQTPYIYQKSCHTSPPKGYVPFYINHLGRHGARYLTSIKELKQIIDILKDAKKHQQLTYLGEKLKIELESLVPLESDNEGLLTPSGYAMEEGIARRMFQNYPEVFGRKVIAVSTYVERTKQSMAAFLGELGRWTSPRCFQCSSNGKVDPILRFFDINEAYLNYKENGKWKEELAQFKQRGTVYQEVLEKIVDSKYIASIQEPEEVVQGLYKIYANQFDIGKNTHLGNIFTQSALCYLWQNENVRQYLLKGPSNIGQVLPTNIAFPLLMDFLNTSEEAIKQKNRSANFRFAHAETIIPFSGLIRLLGFFNQTDSMGQVAVLWQDYLVAPMAANLQWIFYEHPRCKTILIKMLYNESEVRLPIRCIEGPYYDYEVVRSFYLRQLYTLHLNWELPLVEMLKKYIHNLNFQ